MKQTWQNDLKSEYMKKEIVNPYQTACQEAVKNSGKYLWTVVSLVIAGVLVLSVAAVGMATDWFNAPLLKNSSARLYEVPDGYTGIYNAADLEKVRDNFDTNYILMSDIDLGGAEWTPIEPIEDMGHSVLFSGVFNGNGYVIRNFTVNTDRAFAGLFARTSATFLNLGIEDCTVNVRCTDAPAQNTYTRWNEADYGTVAGTAAFIGSCYAENVQLNIAVTAPQPQTVSIGGLVGSVTYIDSCYTDAGIRYECPDGTQCSAGKIAGTAMSMLTSYAIGTGDGVSTLARISTDSNLPFVLETDQFENLYQRIAEFYPEGDYHGNMFKAYYLLKDTALAENAEERAALEDGLRELNSYRNFYGDGEELRPIYVLALDITGDERIMLADILLNALGSDGALHAFYRENGIRAGEMNSVFFPNAGEFSTDLLSGFDAETIWLIDDGKATLRVFEGKKK